MERAEHLAKYEHRSKKISVISGKYLRIHFDMNSSLLVHSKIYYEIFYYVLNCVKLIMPNNKCFKIKRNYGTDPKKYWYLIRTSSYDHRTSYYPLKTAAQM